MSKIKKEHSLLYTLLPVKFYNWVNENKSAGYLFSFLAPNAAGALANVAVGVSTAAVTLLIGLLLTVMYITADLVWADLWNDPEFVDKWNEMEMYLDQIMGGHDCEQEFSDAACDLAVYLLQKKYGDNWREHAPQELLDYYDEMIERKKQSGDSGNKNNSSNDSGSSTSNAPPGNQNHEPIPN